MPQLSTSGPSKMVFEQFLDCFHIKDLMNGLPQLFQLCSHIVKGHIPPQIALVFGTTNLLAMTKFLGGVHLITIGETLYQLISHALCLQFCDAFVTNFSAH
jgi:hypothetical protein